jgi:hypothetical protein
VENPTNKPRLPIELKAYFRDLVVACGGPKRAAEITGGQASHISEAMAAHSVDRWPRLDHIAMLEADCGQPIVTAALADRTGYALQAVSSQGASSSPLRHLSRIVSEVRDVECGVLNAMTDGQLSAAERREVRRQAQEAIAALNAVCGDLLDPPRSPNVAHIGRKGE